LEVNENFLNELRSAINNKSIKETCKTMLNHVIKINKIYYKYNNKKIIIYNI